MKSKFRILSVTLILVISLLIAFPLQASAATLAKPKLTSASSVYKGVLVKWDVVKGAEKYRVFRKDGNSWKRIGDTTSTSYTDSNVTSGKSYTYTVRCIDKSAKNYTSGYDSKGITVKYIAAPKISGFTNTAAGVKLTWNKVNGAGGYRIFYKVGSAYKTLDTVSSTVTAFVDKTVVSGEKRTYTIRCVDSNGKNCSGYSGTGWTQTYIGQPAISSVKSVFKGVSVNWSKVTGAEKYRVFRKNGTSWVQVGDTTGTSLTDTKGVSGTEYTYTVRCIDKAAKKYTSSYDSKGKSVVYIAAPKFSALANTASGVKLSWSKINGTAGYNILYKEDGSDYSILDTVDATATSFVDKTIESGKTRTYTIRCIDSNGKYCSGYSSTGWTQTYVAQPSAKVELAANGLKISWKKVDGAAEYRIFYKNGSSWSAIATTSSTSYLDKTVLSGTTRTYTVRCIDSKGNYCSSYNSTGWKATYAEAPKIFSVKEINGSVSVFWNAITNISKYMVYVKVNDGSWECLGNTSATVFVHYDVEPNTEYTYTVRSASDDGKNAISSYYGTNSNATITTSNDSLADKTETVVISLSTNKSDEYTNLTTLQNALDKATNDKKLTVKIETKGTYYVASSTGRAIIMRSNTTLDLNGSTIIRSGAMYNLIQNASVGQGSIPGDGSGYSMTKNITICNGTLDGTGGDSGQYNLVNIGHANGVKLVEVSFKNCRGGHLVEFAGCKNCIVKNCEFTGFSGDASLDDNEALQIDICNNDVASSNWNGVYKSDSTVCQNIVVDGCSFKDYPSGVGNHHTLKGKHSSGLTVINSSFTNSKNTKQYAVRLYAFDNSTVSGNKVTGNYENGIRVSGGNSVDITCNTVSSKTCDPIYITVSSSYVEGKKNTREDEYASKCKVNNNTITSTGAKAAMSIFTGSGVTEIIGNTIKATGNSDDAEAIIISGSSSVGTIKNNNIYSTYSEGIFVAKNSTVNSITGNTIRGYNEGIFVSSGATVKSITDNTSITSVKESGIYVTGDAKATTISNNVISNCGECGITISSSGITSTINSNNISNCEDYGIRVNNSSLTITVQGNKFSGNGNGSMKISASGNIQSK